MTTRTTLAATHRAARNSGGSRATVREFDDDHLMQEVKQADVFHSETHSGVERWQAVGMTSFPIKQQEDTSSSQKQKTSSGNASEDGDWNHNQPKGPAAEAVMMYINGSRSHPVAMVDDRRVRPYGMSEGEGAHYAPDGSEQMVLFKETGTYVVSLDGKSVKDKDSNKTRMASLRHVTKDMQTHKIEKQQAGQQSQQQEKYKHEGKTINTEVRCVKDRIEFRAGDNVVGYYEVSSDTWFFKGKIATMEFTEKIEETAPKISNTATDRYETVGKTYLGLDTKDEVVPLGETGDVSYKKTFVKLVS